MSSKFILELVTACEAAAIAAFGWYGKGDNVAADKAAVDAMRAEFNKINMSGRIVIGEGERDEAPMLFIGEKVGTGNGPELDIAVDPLEGTTILATGQSGALAVCAATDKGGFLHAPDTYMEKIAIGFDFPEQIISLEETPATNLKNIAKAKKCSVNDLIVTILDRPRHQELISQVRLAGARVLLIGDGDIAGVINTTNNVSDVYMGTGGAPEGVLAAAALHATGGQFTGKLIFRNDDEKARAQKTGIKDLNKIYTRDELASGDIVFVACGVTDGSLVKGIKLHPNEILAESLVMTATDRNVRIISSRRKI